MAEKKSTGVRKGGASRDLRRRAEALLAKSGSEIEALSAEKIKALVHELQVHQMELEIQNEELREAQLELSEARDRYSDLYDFAPVGYLTLDGDGAILGANLTVAPMLGLERSSLIGRLLSDFVPPDQQDALFLFRRRALAADGVQTCDLEMRPPDAAPFSVRLKGVACEANSTAKPCCRVALVDITGKKQAEQWEKLAAQVLEMVEHLPAGAVYVDHETLQMNRVAEAITGYAKDELRTLDQWFKALYGASRGTIRQLYESRYADGFPGPQTLKITRKDGAERLVEFAGHRFDDHAVWILQDVTERIKAQQALRESEARQRAILNTAADAIITFDRKGLMMSANRATERIFGYAESDLLGHEIAMLMPSPPKGEHGGQPAAFLQADEPHAGGVRREMIGRRRDGSTFPADLAVSKVDQLGCYTSIIRDITESKRAEEALRMEHEFSDNLIETTQSIILVLDPDGRIIRFNAVLACLSGWSLDEVEGGDWFEIFLPERHRAGTRERFQSAIEGERTRGRMNPIVTRTGEEREIEWYDAPLRESDGTLIGLICSGIDVTERRLLERQVYQGSEEERLRIAHDLHDGLGSMLTGIGYLAGTISAKLRRGQAVEVREADAIVKHVNNAITQTRALSRGLHGVSDDPEALPTALRELAATVRQISKINCRFMAPKQKISISDAAAANHLFRIAQEAVHNATRHSGASYLTIHLSERDDGALFLSVVDNGTGFDVATMKGHGLGLRTMNYRAGAIGATLSVRRRKKGGTTVECVYRRD